MQTSPKRVLLAGGAGFIGSHIADRLISQGVFVKILDDFSSGKIVNLKQIKDSGSLEVVSGDVLDRALLDEVVSDVDAVINMVGRGNLAKSVEDPRPYHDVNLTGSVNLLTSSVKHGIRKYIGASSGSVYRSDLTGAINEDSPLGPESPYAASKLSSEVYSNAFHITYGIETVNLRFFNVYGPRRENSAYGGAVTNFVIGLIQGEEISIYGDGQDVRDYVFVKDIADGVMRALAPGIHGTYNIGSGTGTTTEELLEEIESVTSIQGKITRKSARKGDSKSRVADIGKAGRVLGYRPSYSLRSGIQELYNYINPLVKK